MDDKVELLTPVEERSRCAVNGFRVIGKDYKKVYEKFAENKVRIRMVPENGLDSLRVSTHIYNNTDEVDKFIGIIKQL
jgi:selenocysteine lyase/cysteine desulfurase